MTTLKVFCVAALVAVVFTSGCKSSPQLAGEAAAATTPVASTETVTLPPVRVQSGAGHPEFKVEYQPLQGDSGVIAAVVPDKTSDEGVIKLLWFFRSMVADQRWKDLGIYPPHVLPSGKTTGLITIYKGSKCVSERRADISADDMPCGGGDHNSGFYQWGIPTDPTNDEAVLVSASGEEKRVFASADDHWKISDEVKSSLKLR